MINWPQAIIRVMLPGTDLNFGRQCTRLITSVPKNTIYRLSVSGSQNIQRILI